MGAVLFNFSDEDLVVNMGDRIAQLIFEKIKTPTIKEADDLEGTDRGAKGYGSTRTNVVQNKDDTMPNSNPDKMDVKVAIATAPVLCLLDFERQFIITTDANDAAIGTTLE